MSKDISRRTVVRSAAWAAPVIAMAVATPLAAASGEPTCERFHHYDPRNYNPYNSMGLNSNVATITVTGNSVIVKFIKDYRNATAIDVNHRIIKKWDNGVKAGTEYVVPLENCIDPTFIQVDGNDTHYYGNGVFR